LDEANSSLDHVGEAALAHAVIEAKREGAAVVVITHRPAVLATADQLLVLKGGRVERLVRVEEPRPALATPSLAVSHA